MIASQRPDSCSCVEGSRLGQPWAGPECAWGSWMWQQSDRRVRRGWPQRDSRGHSRRAGRGLITVRTEEADRCRSLRNTAQTVHPFARSANPASHIRYPITLWGVHSNYLHVLSTCCVQDSNIHHLLIVSFYSHNSRPVGSYLHIADKETQLGYNLYLQG